MSDQTANSARSLRAFINFAKMGVLPSTERAVDAAATLKGLDESSQSALALVRSVIEDVGRGILPMVETCRSAQQQLKAVLSGDQELRDSDMPTN